MNRPPTFDGRSQSINAVDDFVAEFETYCIAYQINGQRRLDFFDSLIRQPAKQEYDAALDDNTQMAWPAPLPDDADQNAINADLNQRLEIRTAWLHNHYQGPCQYQLVQGKLQNLKQ